MRKKATPVVTAELGVRYLPLRARSNHEVLMRATQGRAGPTHRAPRIDKVPSPTPSQRACRPRPPSSYRRNDLPRCPPTHKITEAGNEQYLQPIGIQASDDSSGAGVTVQDVLRTINEGLRELPPVDEWKRLSKDDRAEVLTSFKERCKGEGRGRGKGISKIVHVCGGNSSGLYRPMA
jgi:hypothetical protein